MLIEIGEEAKIDAYVEKAKEKDDPFKLLGFGHRVYKNFDPSTVQSSAHAVWKNKVLEMIL